MVYLINIIRVFVGLLFVLSGAVKAIDPLGLSFKLKEYFEEEILNLPFLIDYALPIALFVIALEIILGVLLLVGTQRKWVFFMLFSLILFFGFLTFYSAFYNKVTDCGCFGDALKLTPWQSFYKNLVLFGLILILIIGRSYIKTTFSSLSKNSIVLSSLAIYVFIAYYGLFHLPVIDFRAYKEGSNILQGMKSAKELGLQESKTSIFYTLRNKKNGKEKEMSDEVYINQNWWEKPEWEIDTTKTKEKLIVKGYEPPVKDFIINCEGKEVTQDLLKEEKLILITAYSPENISDKAMQAVLKMKLELEQKKVKVIFISTKKLKGIKNCTMDETVLKTMIRANPGIMVINKATILKEYHWNDMPETKEFLALFN